MNSKTKGRDGGDRAAFKITDKRDPTASPHRNKARKRATADEMAERHDVLIAIVADIEPCTVRQVFYQATVRHAFEKSERGYDLVHEALAKLRRDGAIPFEHIVDNTRREQASGRC